MHINNTKSILIIINTTYRDREMSSSRITQYDGSHWLIFLVIAKQRFVGNFGFGVYSVYTVAVVVYVWIFSLLDFLSWIDCVVPINEKSILICKW